MKKLILIFLTIFSSNFALDICPICRGEFSKKDIIKNLTILNCSPEHFHAYHTDCLNLWLERSDQCPLCRLPVNILSGMAHLKAFLYLEKENNKKAQILFKIMNTLDKTHARLNFNRENLEKMMTFVMVGFGIFCLFDEFIFKSYFLNYLKSLSM